MEYVADRAAPQSCLGVPRHAGERRSAHEHLARRRVLEAPGNREQRALTGAARPHHRDERAGVNGQVDTVQGPDLCRSVSVDLRDPTQLENAHNQAPFLAAARADGY